MTIHHDKCYAGNTVMGQSLGRPVYIGWSEKTSLNRSFELKVKREDTLTYKEMEKSVAGYGKSMKESLMAQKGRVAQRTRKEASAAGVQ